jgi:nitrate/nitrite transport system permease protein
MVLIAIELLAQSPGLGSFVWEEFQNGSIDSNAKIIVAMFVIGIIGFMLDRIMLTIQNMVSFNKNEGV